MAGIDLTCLSVCLSFGPNTQMRRKNEKHKQQQIVALLFFLPVLSCEVRHTLTDTQEK